MTMRYAQRTGVSSERFKAEIERLLTRFGIHSIETCGAGGVSRSA